MDRKKSVGSFKSLFFLDLPYAILFIFSDWVEGYATLWPSEFIGLYYIGSYKGVAS
jgi:hypothetical protein